MRHGPHAAVASVVVSIVVPACSRNEPTPPTPPAASVPAPTRSVPPAASSSASAPAASSSASPPPRPVLAYAPLPRPVACDLCKAPGTGCHPDDPKRCVLDPSMPWKVQVTEIHTLPGDPADGNAGLSVPGVDAGAFLTFTASGGKLGTGEPGILTTAELTGLEELTINVGTHGSLTAAEKLAVGPSFGKQPITFRGADGEWLRVRVEAAPGAKVVPRIVRPLFVPAALGAAGAGVEDAAAAARKAAGIDAKLQDLDRKVARTHRTSGFELQLVGFFDRGKLVRLSVLAPYTPPTELSTHYFEGDDPVAVRVLAVGMPQEGGGSTNEASARFFARGALAWTIASDGQAAVTPPQPTKVTAKVWLRALTTPSFHFEDRD